MTISPIADVLQKTAIDMRAFAARNRDLELPEQVILPFIMNFLTDQLLRKLSAVGLGGHRTIEDVAAEAARPRALATFASV